MSQIDEGLLTFLITAGIKDIANLFGLQIDGAKTLVVAGIVAAMLVAGLSYALQNGLISPQVANLIAIVLSIISAAGVNRLAKTVGNYSRVMTPKK